MPLTRTLQTAVLLALLTLSAGCQTTIGNYFGSRANELGKNFFLVGGSLRHLPYERHGNLKKRAWKSPVDDGDRLQIPRGERPPSCPNSVSLSQEHLGSFPIPERALGATALVKCLRLPRFPVFPDSDSVWLQYLWS